jgi:alpha/beta superfamily hydrolase
MLAELIRLNTSDGLSHPGAFYAAKSARPAPLGVVIVHGLTGSFVGEIETALPPLLAEAGYSTLVFNNRGTGIVGGATERFAGCIPDIRAAIDWMETRGFSQIALFGHSKAGAKVAYYLVKTGDPRVTGLSVLSPVDSAHDIIHCQAPQFGKRNPSAWLERVKTLAGDVLFADRNWPYLMSAGTAADHLALTDDNTLDNLAALSLPILAACGSLELDWCKTVAALLREPPPGYRVAVIEGADHVYTGHEKEMADLMIDWMNTLG